VTATPPARWTVNCGSIVSTTPLVSSRSQVALATMVGYPVRRLFVGRPVEEVPGHKKTEGYFEEIR
jgi:hypothetical protein